MTDNNLIKDYLLSFAIAQTTDYQIKSSVAKHNRAMNKCRKIATEIQINYPELKESFADLLNKEPEMSLLVAHHIIEVMQYPDNIKSKALSIIKEKSKEDSTEGLGNKMWLKDYLHAHPKDKKLIR